jgi:ABC-type Fe3+/spermidine/putrescine transport system ATPase subunit
VALDRVSLQIRHGEFYTLLGPSGCGKTTTLNIIGGFIPVSSGQVYINGKPVADDPPYRRNVNTVFQSYALFPHMTVAQNIGFGPRMAKVPQAEIDRRVEDILALISLPDFGNRRPGQLSGGQQQRIALARALINEPDVLLLDEPLGALDLKIRKQLQGELLNIQRKVGITFVYVTHDQEEAMVLSDRIAVMDRGRVVQEDTPVAIYYRPVNRFVANFIGESNFFHGKALEVRAGEAWIGVPGFVRPVRVMCNSDMPRAGGPTAAGVAAAVAPAAPSPSGQAARLRPGQEVTVMVRPERMGWAAGESASGETVSFLDNLAEGTVRKSAFLGMYTQIVVELADGATATIHDTGEAGAEGTAQRLMGQRIYIGWKVQDGQVLTE